MNSQIEHSSTICNELSDAISEYVLNEQRKLIKIISEGLAKVSERIKELLSMLANISLNIEYKIIFNYRPSKTYKTAVDNTECIPNAPPNYLLEKIEVRYIWFQQFILPIVLSFVIKYVESELFSYSKDLFTILLRFLGVI